MTHKAINAYFGNRWTARSDTIAGDGVFIFG
jgi:hypothetical protein